VEPDSDLDGLRGRVRHVAARQTSRLNRDDGESVYRTARAITLDSAGQVTERSWEQESGASSRTVYAYGPHGKLTETVETGRNPDGERWTFRRFYTYDDNGRLIEERHERADGSLVRGRRPVYTADGRRIEEQRFESRSRGACAAHSIAVDGSNESFIAPSSARLGRVVYDVSGAPVDITFKGRLGVTVGRIVFESDAAGRTTAIRSYGETGQFYATMATWARPIGPVVDWASRRMLNGWLRWNLVRRGRWRTLAQTVVWGPLWFETFRRYDVQGHRVEERNRFGGTAYESIETWTYDADGRLVEHGDRDQTGTVTNHEEYAYQVDALGNWVHRTILRPRRPHSAEEMIDTTERTIDYFE
jgi:YD repeat-containing protein